MSSIESYVAEIMDWEYIYILCPNCVKNKNKFKENDSNCKNFKRVYHIYNTNNDYSNRTMRVKSNCLFKRKNSYIDVIINHDTMRIYK